MSKIDVVFSRARGRRIVHFIHVGKTGGTALKTALATHTKSQSYHILLHDHNFVLRMVPPGNALFFFLRHPLTRFISGFYSRQREGKPRHYYPWRAGEAKAFARFKTPNELALALSSPDPDVRGSAWQAMRSIQHVRDTYYDYFFGDMAALMTRRNDILFIGFQERLDADFERLKHILGLPADLLLPTDEVSRHSNPVDAQVCLDQEARVNLQAWYAEDIGFYQACFKEFG